MVLSLLRDWKKSWGWWQGAKLLPYIFLLLPWINNAATPGFSTFHFQIPATTLEDALTKFSAQSGISVGMPGKLPRVVTRPVTGEYSVHDALQLLLTDTGLEALPLAGLVYRLQPRAVTVEVPAQVPAVLSELPEVRVTGTKRDQDLRTVPVSMTVIHGAEFAHPGVPNGSRAAMLQDAAMSSTNLGPGRNRQYIRGVADSPFLGPTQATVSVQFDEARVTYDGPDPDLRLFDVARVEILKGPQGPLYGTGALGGVFRIEPRRVDLDQMQLQGGFQVTDLAGGAAGTGADILLNAPLVAGKVGLRAVVYASTEPGWIDNTPGRSDANSTRIRGARVALRSVLPHEWVVDLQGVAQFATSSDSQYLIGASHPLRRSNILPEPHDNDFHLGAVTARGRFLGHDALLTVSTVSHEADGLLDASASAAEWSVTAPVRYLDDRRYQLVNQELRLWSEPAARLGWLLGASHLSAHSNFAGSLLPGNSAARIVLLQAQHVQEAALFGELVVPIAVRMRTTLGLRVWRSTIENERTESAAQSESEFAINAATPSVSLDWRSADERQFVYLRYARAIRPGGLNPAEAEADDEQYSRRFAADELSNVDLGLRLSLQHAVQLQGAVFATRWSHIQSDYLLTNGLIGTRNVGSGRNLGVEASADWSAGNHWQLAAGATLQHARLHDIVDEGPEDRRLPVVPDLRLRGSVTRALAIADWRALLRADVNYMGASRLSFDESLDRKTPAYAALDTRISLQRAGIELTLAVANVFNSHADTFAFGNSFSIRSNTQHTPLQPRAVSFGVSYGW